MIRTSLRIDASTEVQKEVRENEEVGEDEEELEKEGLKKIIFAWSIVFMTHRSYCLFFLIFLHKSPIRQKKLNTTEK